MDGVTNNSSIDACPKQLAGLFATLAKSGAIYPRNHPRVQQAAAQLELACNAAMPAPKWLRIRVRDQELSIGDITVGGGSPGVAWLVQRCREASLTGVEVGPGVDAEALIEFTVALGRSGGKQGKSLVTLWPQDHPTVRPLELVFLGDHQEVSATESASGSDTAGHVDFKQEVLARFAADTEIQTRLALLCRSCGSSEASLVADIDVLEEIVQLMPDELVSDQERAGEVLKQVLDRLHAGLVELHSGQPRVDNSAVLRESYKVAKEYFESPGGAGVLRNALPEGRPEDAAITADLAQLLVELEALPEADTLRLPPASWFLPEAPAQRGELLGIALHLLTTTERLETPQRLKVVLPQLLTDFAVLDAYLRVMPGESRSAASDAAVLKILECLTDLGQCAMVLERQYVYPELIARTYPASLALAVRVCGLLPSGIEVLRRGLMAIDRDRLAAGAKTLDQLGTLRAPAVLQALVAVGGRTVLPLMAGVAALDDPAVRELVVGYLRAMQLPDAEAAALRGVHPASKLSKRYVLMLCQIAESGEGDADARLSSGQLLCAFIDKIGPSLPPQRYLQAIAGLRHLQDPGTVALLSTLAKRGRFTSFGRAARAVRKTARDALASMQKELPRE